MVVRAAVITLSLAVLAVAVAARANGPGGVGAAAGGPTAKTSTTAVQPTTTARPTTTVGPTTTTVPPTTVSAPTSTTVPQRPSQAFCDAARSATELVRQIAVTLTDPTALRTELDQGDAALATAANAAPADVRATVGFLQTTVSSLHAALDGAGYDLSKLQTAVVTKAGSPEVFTAVRDLDGYTAKAC
jgi:predicted secreted protein